MQDSKGGGEGFEVTKYGDGRVALIGETCSRPGSDLTLDQMQLASNFTSLPCTPSLSHCKGCTICSIAIALLGAWYRGSNQHCLYVQCSLLNVNGGMQQPLRVGALVVARGCSLTFMLKALFRLATLHIAHFKAVPLLAPRDKQMHAPVMALFYLDKQCPVPFLFKCTTK